MYVGGTSERQKSGPGALGNARLGIPRRAEYLQLDLREGCRAMSVPVSRSCVQLRCKVLQPPAFVQCRRFCCR